MAVLVQQKAPSFTAEAVMEDGQFKQIKLEDYRGKYVLLFFYPLDFTFVCPTEIISFSDRGAEFQSSASRSSGSRSTAPFPTSRGGTRLGTWAASGTSTYPLIADLKKDIARAYDVLLPDGVALRGLFLIDPEGVVRHQVVNDLPLGRSVDEALRMVKALQFTEKHGEVCPANWQEGSRTIKPTTADSKEFFGAEYGGKK